ncbi:hypothetical protein EXIGLDRAFT_78542 [Exidia glandulosa HHB12029]|uniref:Uncharacterized protein n=1 Tax=Exidia glandulosa HHB12029 TaxID=1314781 RepID=A0A165HP02_EXIGL|nr:hypothetical protein EXIGLDRAFT_78542 [Exidia glandulosa HHB12029]
MIVYARSCTTSQKLWRRLPYGIDACLSTVHADCRSNVNPYATALCSAPASLAHVVPRAQGNPELISDRGSSPAGGVSRTPRTRKTELVFSIPLSFVIGLVAGMSTWQARRQNETVAS